MQTDSISRKATICRLCRKPVNPEGDNFEEVTDESGVRHEQHEDCEVALDDSDLVLALASA